MAQKRELKCIILVIGLTLMAASSYSQDVRLEIIPAELKFDTQAEQNALVVVRNGGSSALKDVRLQSLTPANFTVSAVPAENVQVSSGADTVWQLDVRQRDSAGGGDRVLLWVEYSVAQGETTTRRTLTGSLNVTGPALPAADSLLTITVDSTIESLTEQTPGRMYLSLQNKSRYPLAIGDITSENEFIEMETIAKPSVVQVSETAVVILRLKSSGPVRPGKYLVVANVPFSWIQGTRSFNATAVAKREIPVGVFGESDILKLLAIPSFLVLPGFLFVTTLGLLWKLKLFRKDNGESKFVLQPSTPEFWLVAITVSMIMAFLYPRLNLGNDYLQHYELTDVVKVWTISIVGFGVLGYAIGALIARMFALARATLAMQSTIAVTDDPIVVLEKLDKVGTGLRPDRAKLAESGEYAYIYQRRPPGEDTLIIGPLLKLSWNDNADDSARRMVDRLLSDPGKGAATRLANQLKMMRADSFNLQWDKTGTLTGLRSAAPTELLPRVAPSSIPLVRIT